MSNTKNLYCRKCMHLFHSDNASQTICPKCRGETQQDGVDNVGKDHKNMMCERCLKFREHKRVGPYNGKHYWKCLGCGHWELIGVPARDMA